MLLIVTPGNPLRGTVRLSGDKSLSHRAALFAALAEGQSRIENFLISGVTRAMLGALTALGVDWKLNGTCLEVNGRGWKALREPAHAIDCGNSATTIRMLAGALAAAGIPCVLDGSAGLRRRPMGRVVEPLRKMGVRIDDSGGCAPLRLHSRLQKTTLHALIDDLPVASAQVKTCMLLAGLAADGETIVSEPGPSRDHTERMLRSMGVNVQSDRADDGRYITRMMPPVSPLRPLHVCLPGDFSAAAFLIVAAAITPGSEVRIESVGLNPTRTGLLDALLAMGALITTQQTGEQAGEPVGSVTVRAAQLSAGKVRGPLVVRMIDEFPAFAGAAVYARGTTTVQDAAELRLKESDRIGVLCGELEKLGARVQEREDGFVIDGGTITGGRVEAHRDHRLAMSLAVTGLAAEQPVTVVGSEIIGESFPNFVETLRGLGADVKEAIR